MLERLPTVPTAQEVLDKAFRKADKVEVQDPDKYHRVRKTMEQQMRTICDIACETLTRIHKSWPTLEDLRPYERELLDIVAGVDDLRKSLHSVQWARDKVRDVYAQQADRMRRERTIEGIKARKRQFSGRASSILYDVDGALTILRTARDAARVLPTVHPGFATVVIAGFPNVGKSTLLRAWTRADPEVAAYAFTTKKSHVGHMDVEGPDGMTKVQFVDTPGLLDRPEEERNDVERHAVAALRHVADCVVFLVDPTGTSGFSPADQEHLLADTLTRLSGVPFVVAESKADLLGADADPPAEGRLRFSATTGEGMEALREHVLSLLPLDEPIFEEDPLDRWKREA